MTSGTGRGQGQGGTRDERQPVEEPGDDSGLPPLADDETGDLADELPADEEGNLLDDSTIGEELGLEDLGIDTGDDEQGWTRDSEGDDSGRAEDLGDLGQSEYGWTNDLEEQGTDDWDEDLEDWDGKDSVLEDDGEEGADEETDLDLTFDPLGTEDDSEDDDDDVAEEAPGFDAESRAEDLALPPGHDASRVLLRSLGPVDAAGARGAILSVLVCTGTDLLGGGQGLYQTTESGALEPARGAASRLEGEDVTSIAVCGGEIAVGTLLGGVFVTAEGLRSFRAANSWVAGSRVSTSAFVCATSRALVLRTGDGDLFTSQDGGASWSRAPLDGRVVAHAASSDGRVRLLVATPHGPAIATSDDGIAFRLGPIVPELRAIARAPEVQMATERDLVVIVADDFADGALASRDGGGTFELWSAVRCCSAVAIDPARPESCVLALCFPGRNLAPVVRTTDAGATFSTIFELGKLRALLRIDPPMDSDLCNRVNGLAFVPGREGILVASTAGAFVIKVRDEQVPPPDPA